MIKIRKLQNKNSSYLIKFYQSRIYSHANQQVCSQMGFTPNTDTFRDCVSRTYNTYLLEP